MYQPITRNSWPMSPEPLHTSANNLPAAQQFAGLWTSALLLSCVLPQQRQLPTPSTACLLLTPSVMPLLPAHVTQSTSSRTGIQWSATSKIPACCLSGFLRTPLYVIHVALFIQICFKGVKYTDFRNLWLLLGTKAPVMRPRGAEFSFCSLFASSSDQRGYLSSYQAMVAWTVPHTKGLCFWLEAALPQGH